MSAPEETTYFFRSGKYKGRTLDWVFLHDPTHVSQIYRQMFNRRIKPIRRENALQLAIEDLMQKIKRLGVSQTCPLCKQEKVNFFLLPEAGFISEKLVCCSNLNCQHELKLMRPGSLHEINDLILFIAPQYMQKKEAKTLIKIFKRCHGKYLQEAFI